MEFKKENGFALADFHGINVVASISGISIGMGDTATFKDPKKVQVMIQTTLVFPDGSEEYKTGLNVITTLWDLPNVPHYVDEEKTIFHPDIVAFYVDKMVEMTNPIEVSSDTGN